MSSTCPDVRFWFWVHFFGVGGFFDISKSNSEQVEPCQRNSAKQKETLYFPIVYIDLSETAWLHSAWCWDFCIQWLPMLPIDLLVVPLKFEIESCAGVGCVKICKAVLLVTHLLFKNLVSHLFTFSQIAQPIKSLRMQLWWWAFGFGASKVFLAGELTRMTSPPSGASRMVLTQCCSFPLLIRHLL